MQDDILAKLEDDMELRGLSDSTREAYRRNVRLYLDHIGKPIGSTCEQDLRGYALHLRHERGLAEATINSYLAAAVFLYEVVCDRALNRKQIPYRKRRRTLPAILSRAEVAALIDASANAKHRAVLMLAYSAGLRASEIAALKAADIDSGSMRILVRGGKGGKDRYTVLSATCLEALRRYWRGHRPAGPEGWLFPAQGGRGHMARSTIGSLFDKARAASGIGTRASIHTLRHCFATHLLEQGASIMDVKELMGHASLSSTAVYLHLADVPGRVASPLDLLGEGGCRHG